MNTINKLRLSFNNAKLNYIYTGLLYMFMGILIMLPPPFNTIHFSSIVYGLIPYVFGFVVVLYGGGRANKLREAEVLAKAENVLALIRGRGSDEEEYY